jgi:glucose-6-phosphate 1-dehydrogenase
MANPLLFTLEDSVEASWRVVAPVLNNDTPVYEYKPGTWGPKEADGLIVPHGIWPEPKDL